MTSQENYTILQNQIKDEIKRIEFELDKHEDLFYQNQVWGYVGDLFHLRQQLSELKVF